MPDTLFDLNPFFGKVFFPHPKEHTAYSFFFFVFEDCTSGTRDKGIPNNSTQNELRDAPEKRVRTEKNISLRDADTQKQFPGQPPKCRSDRHRHWCRFSSRVSVSVSGSSAERLIKPFTSVWFLLSSRLSLWEIPLPVQDDVQVERSLRTITFRILLTLAFNKFLLSGEKRKFYE